MADRKQLKKAQTFVVVKANDVVRKTRYELSAREQKALMYLISKIRPADKPGGEYTIQIREFCETCNITTAGTNYADIKAIFEKLVMPCTWLQYDDGTEKMFSWLSNDIEIKRGSGVIKYKFLKHVEPFLLELRNNFTRYSLDNVLKMGSKYSLRLYEILKSYESIGHVTFDIDELKEKLNAAHYVNFKDFRVNVLDKAVQEINDATDIDVQYETEKRSKRIAAITFYVNEPDPVEDEVRALTRKQRLTE